MQGERPNPLSTVCMYFVAEASGTRLFTRGHTAGRLADLFKMLLLIPTWNDLLASIYFGALCCLIGLTYVWVPYARQQQNRLPHAALRAT